MSEEVVKIYKGNKETVVSLDNLQAELSQCLQIENLNFLIGSGCSSYKDDSGQEQAI